MRESDRAEFREFVAARSPALRRTALLLTGDGHLAEDLLQTALVKTWRRWARIRDRGAVEAYTRRTMVTTVVSWRRRRWSGERVTATGELPEVLAPPDMADARLALLAALRGLPPRQRAVVVLRYYEDLPEAEVAHLLGVAPGTVRSSASRGLAALRAGRALTDWAPLTTGERT